MTGGLQLQAGGTLNPRQHIYVERREDAQFLRLLLEGEYVNVLTSRQMGKSSLMMQAVHRLNESGMRYVTIDLASELGRQSDLDAYYLGLLSKVVRALGLELDLAAWWEEHQSETVNQRLLRFFREVVGDAIAEPIVIFLDEIDSTITLPYTDDLFTAIRGMYNERALVDAYGRITFCLLGVATPNELIKDQHTTAYNVGTTLTLRDFDRETNDLRCLSAALSDDAKSGERLLGRVLYWTGGHPYLTCKICADLARTGVDSPQAVDAHVERAFASLDQVTSDVHFQQILRFMGRRLSDEAATIALYRTVIAGERVPDRTSLAHAELKLSGLVKRGSDGCLTIRNPIYRRLFDESWVASTRPSRAIAAYRQRFIAASTTLAGVLSLTLIAGAYWWSAVKPYQDARNALLQMKILVSQRSGGGIERIEFPNGAAQTLLDRAAEHLERLGAPKALDLESTQVTDVTPLKGLTGLESLTLSDTQVTDVTPLKNLTGLGNLSLSNTQVTDVTPLIGLTALRSLSLSDTQVTDVTPLKGLTSLERLDLNGTEVADVTPLKGLTSLLSLNLDSTAVADVTPLKGLTDLWHLSSSNTQVTDVTPLKGLTSLRTLNLDGTEVADVTPLKGLTSLRTLNLDGTEVADVTPLKGLSALRSLALSGTQVADVTPLKGLNRLSRLSLSGTRVTDVTPLRGLTNLRILSLANTQVTDVTPLRGLTNLRRLNIRNTPVSPEEIVRLGRTLRNATIQSGGLNSGRNTDR